MPLGKIGRDAPILTRHHDGERIHDARASPNCFVRGLTGLETQADGDAE